MAIHYRSVLDADGPEASRALWEWGRELESQSRWRDAEALYTEYLDRFPRSQRYRDVFFRRGFARFRQTRTEEAMEDFRAALRTSRSRSQEEQAAFWLARSLQRLGREEEAQAAARAGATHPEPADGYGVLLRARFLSGPIPPPDTARAGEDSPFDAIDPAEWPQPVAYHFERGLRLVELGQQETARREWARCAHLGRRIPSLVQSLALVAAAHNVYPEGVRWANLAARSLPAGHPHERGYQRLAYPAAYYSHVVREAARFGVDPWSLWALMRQESFYDPQAVSRAGALGLMQVMPATLRRVIAESGFVPVPVEALFEPRVNIAMGTRFFSDRLKEFSHRLLPTLASYNAGESKSWEWLDRAEGDAEEVYIESIGYPETYEYVRRILWLIWVYESYYDAGTGFSSSGSEAR
jgi:soluble lytic murein transglycosylase